MRYVNWYSPVSGLFIFSFVPSALAMWVLNLYELSVSWTAMINVMEWEESCHVLVMNFPKLSLRSSSSDVEEKPSRYEWKKWCVSNRTCFFLHLQICCINYCQIAFSFFLWGFFFLIHFNMTAWCDNTGWGF